LQLFAIEFTSLSTEGGARECFGVSIVPPVIKFKSIEKLADSGNKKLPERLVLTVSRHFCLTVEQSVFHRFGLTSHWKLGQWRREAGAKERISHYDGLSTRILGLN
jgi:hypothetical protein